MSLKLAKNNTPTYDYFSEGDDTDPISVTVTLDNTGGTTESSEATAYLVATTFNYTGITVEPVNEVDSGINWQVSLSAGTGFAESVTPSNMDALSADVVTPIYLKAVNANDGSVATGNYTAANVRVTATENPS